MDIFSKPERDYPVLDPEERVSVSGKDITVNELVVKSAPVLYIHKKLDYMRPVRTLFEALTHGELIIINYYVHWKDEIHPNPLFHKLYRGFRSVIYGSPADIEYVQVGVSLETGEIVRIAFEKDPLERPDAPAPRHDVIVCERPPGSDKFSITVNGKPSGISEIDFNAERPKILVATWNHIYDFYKGKGVLMEDPPLKAMSDKLYIKYFMHRRSKPPL